ncbi:response regulator transcription factor [Sulfurimonas sp.]|uniref:response regulator transcription factor n=1 Tax=Sulfurimonas sp. TaxID=2022749 RepID=UPI00356AEDAE
MKLLIINSNKVFNQNFKEYFSKKSFSVDSYENCDTLLNYKNINHIIAQYDVIFLSIEKDKLFALDVLDHINVLGIHAAVIFLSYVDSIDLMSKAFARNCEDYILHPFSLKEIELRAMKAVRKKMKSDEISLVGDYTYTLSQHAVFNDHQYIKLTKIELSILYLLIIHKNQIVSHEKIVNFVWKGKDILQNTLSVHIKNLKKKITGLPIDSIKGIGYSIRLDH